MTRGLTAPRRWRTMALLAVAVGAVVGVPALASPAAAAPAAATTATGTVTLVHGLPGVVADVTVDGKEVIKSFAPERITDPLSLPAGVHQFAVRPTGAAPTSAPAVSGSFAIAAGSRLSVAVGLDAAGQPMAHVYDDAASGLAAGAAGVIVRNVADVADARASLDGAPLGGTAGAGSVVNSSQRATVATTGSHTVTVTDTAGTTTLVKAQTVPVRPSTASVLYLIGRPGSYTWLADQVATVTPDRVNTGTSGLVADHSTPPAVVPALIGFAVVAAAGLVGWRRRRVWLARRGQPGTT
ncbi:DUF4397 domain-containing protein [Frankia sp. AgB1.9]|uniref:DUF4397 domain-containing protein n=1 Tax=unclassified Frankia TaxID=2632575 RepID=UPI0019341942|nr:MULTISPECIES: DUF4397 domain-containing protein [unclassified Frankia]MBL7489992.1 DUF4397 domain-containing protein [Frankia sp. AgW1.1]MBL7553168.1 DUF4397 domain-containing protein [Frankia sp. AgB1.9]MBL7625481.1 DUF4397 domain-containing protein [Frankia sp. AgB1.8]